MEMMNDLKELERFLKICRKLGVTEISMDGVSVKLGALPSKNTQADDSEEIPTDELTPEQMMFYAVNGGQQ